MCGTTHKTVKRIIENDGVRAERASEPANYELVRELVAAKVDKTSCNRRGVQLRAASKLSLPSVARTAARVAGQALVDASSRSAAVRGFSDLCVSSQPANSIARSANAPAVLPSALSRGVCWDKKAQKSAPLTGFPSADVLAAVLEASGVVGAADVEPACFAPPPPQAARKMNMTPYTARRIFPRRFTGCQKWVASSRSSAVPKAMLLWELAISAPLSPSKKAGLSPYTAASSPRPEMGLPVSKVFRLWYSDAVMTSRVTSPLSPGCPE
jgi:hypothetical protein